LAKNIENESKAILQFPSLEKIGDLHTIIETGESKVAEKLPKIATIPHFPPTSNKYQFWCAIL
jgi:hypothetical protein